MIQIYSPKNKNFKMNGDMTLLPTKCEVLAELGGAWVLDLKHSIDEENRWKYIEKEAVLSVPTFMGKNQLFRIAEITDKTDTEISVKAYPIFFDSANDCFLMDVRPTDKNAQEALNTMMEGSVYSGESDIDTVNTAYFIRRNLMDAISGEDSPTFIEKWGGEPLYDNYKIILNKRVGSDNGAEIRYGKNMIGVNVSEDMSHVITRIVPTAYNGRTLSTNHVDSPNIDKYAKIYTREIQFTKIRLKKDVADTEDTSGLIVCETQEELDAELIKQANEQFDLGIDVYKLSIEVDMVALENTEEYKDFADIAKISLGDTTSCYNTKLDIKTKARAVKICWNCITDSAKNVLLGNYKHNFLDQWKSTAEQIADKAAKKAIDAQTQLDIFNKLTNNGALQGVFMDDGLIYINGTYIRVDDLNALGATIGGWKIGEDAIYSNVTTNEGTYRVYIQRYLESFGTDSWIYSIQKLREGTENTYDAVMFIRGDGKMYSPGFISELTFEKTVHFLSEATVSGNLIAESVRTLNLSSTDTSITIDGRGYKGNWTFALFQATDGKYYYIPARLSAT